MMPRIAFINPNSTELMTEEMVAVARAAAGASAEVIGLTNRAGPPAIQGAEDAAACLPGLFATCDAALRAGVDAIVVGCFDDTGLDEVRAMAGCPVTGLGEAGCLVATLHSPDFAVVTTTAGSVPVIEENILRMGLAPRCRGVFAAHVPVLDLLAGIDRVQATLQSVSATAPGAAIVLGCAGMSPLADRIAAGATVPVIDPARAALGLVLSALDATRTPRVQPALSM